MSIIFYIKNKIIKYLENFGFIFKCGTGKNVCNLSIIL